MRFLLTSCKECDIIIIEREVIKIGKEEFKNKLINNYKLKMSKDNGTTQLIACIARDEMRKIRKIFEKNFHEPIDNYL